MELNLKLRSKHLVLWPIDFSSMTLKQFDEERTIFKGH